MEKSLPPLALTMACLAIVIGLIISYAPGTVFDDGNWSVTLLDTSSIGNSPSETFEFRGGRGGETRLVGRYFLPEVKDIEEEEGRDGRLPPAVIMAHGLGLAQDCSLNSYVETFTAEGMAVFTFDYATFGISEGLPRNEVDPKTHVSDVQAALNSIRNQFTHKVDVTRIALWGTSLAGGHVLNVALSPGVTDEEIRAVVAQVPHLASGLETVLATVISDPITYLPSLGMIMAGLLKAILLRILHYGTQQLSPSGWLYFPLHGKPGSLAAMQNPGDDEGYGQLCETTKRVGLWRNAMTAISVPRLLFYRPLNLIYRRRNNAEHQPAVLLVGAEEDTLCPARYAKEASGHIHGSELFVLEGASHFDVYNGEALQKVLQREVSFLKKHLFRD